MASGLAEYERDLICALSGENIMVCPPQIQQRLLERTRKVVKNYQNENPDATWDNIEGFLGDPHELAQLFLEVTPGKGFCAGGAYGWRLP